MNKWQKQLKKKGFSICDGKTKRTGGHSTVLYQKEKSEKRYCYSKRIENRANKGKTAFTKKKKEFKESSKWLNKQGKTKQISQHTMHLRKRRAFKGMFDGSGKSLRPCPKSNLEGS